MLSSLGIHSYFTTNKSTICKESYDINISRDRAKFVKLIGFLQTRKNNKIDVSKQSVKPPKISYDIISSEPISTEDVYDITVDNTSHTFWCNGFNISNCSEIAMCIDDSCRLLLENLLKFVVNPFTKDAYFDFELFHIMTKRAQR